jgi:hypothetical protein
MYTSAAKRYLQSKYCDSTLVGVLVRDVEPKNLDLRQRAISSVKDKSDLTEISFYAIYLPTGMIPKLPEMIAPKDQQ